MTWITVAIIGGGATLASGYMGAQAAKDAANKQTEGANAAIRQQREMFDIQNAQQKPYREAGYTALSDIAGMKPYLNKQYSAEDFYADPSYQFRIDQSNAALRNQQNLTGGQFGGNTLYEMAKLNSGLAATEYGAANTRFQNERTGIYDRLASIAGIGQTSQGQTSQLAENVAGNIGKATISSAKAQGAGDIAAANAYGGALENAANMYSMSKYLRPAGGISLNQQNYGLSQNPIDLANPFQGAKMPMIAPA